MVNSVLMRLHILKEMTKLLSPNKQTICKKEKSYLSTKVQNRKKKFCYKYFQNFELFIECIPYEQRTLIDSPSLPWQRQLVVDHSNYQK